MSEKIKYIITIDNEPWFSYQEKEQAFKKASQIHNVEPEAKICVKERIVIEKDYNLLQF